MPKNKLDMRVKLRVTAIPLPPQVFSPDVSPEQKVMILVGLTMEPSVTQQYRDACAKIGDSILMNYLSSS